MHILSSPGQVCSFKQVLCSDDQCSPVETGQSGGAGSCAAVERCTPSPSAQPEAQADQTPDTAHTLHGAE